MPKNREDYAPDVGGFLDDTDGDIVEARFGVATGEYADKIIMGGGDVKPPVVITLTVEGPELEKPQQQSFSVGSSDLWEISDDEKSIKNVKNPDKHGFRKGSRAYSLVEAMFMAVGKGDLEKGQDFFINRDVYMTDARFYEGLSFHWATVKLPTVEGKAPSNVPLPDKFLGDRKTAKGKPAETKKITSINSTEVALDTIILANISGKTDRDIKGFAVRSAEIKKDSDYLKGVVSGTVLKRLEDSGQITKDPESGKYL